MTTVEWHARYLGLPVDFLASLAIVDGLNARYIKHNVRESGEPYYSHVINVMSDLLDLYDVNNPDSLPYYIVIAGGCHDLIEDTVDNKTPYKVTGETLYEAFKIVDRDIALKIAWLVMGVTKPSKKEIPQMTKRAFAFREKFVQCAQEDPLIGLIRLADRRHNLSTLAGLKSESRQRRVARETLNFYVPWARVKLKKQLPAYYHPWLEKHAYQLECFALAFLHGKASINYKLMSKPQP